MKNNLKRIREEYRMDQMQFAIFLEVHYNTYRGWENETSQPPLEIAIKIVEKLNRKVEDIWHK